MKSWIPAIAAAGAVLFQVQGRGGLAAERMAITDFGQAEIQVWPAEVTCLFPEQTNRFRWSEVVASWNARLDPGTTLEVELQPRPTPEPCVWFSFGLWESGAGASGRRSLPGQERAGGVMHTDTLVLREPAPGFRARFTLRGVCSPALLHRLHLTFSADTPDVGPASPPSRAGWGESLAVPQLCQLDSEGGGAWCSPTAVAMMVRFWGIKLRRPDLHVDVPSVAAQVVDPAWPGTGNWAFNMAWAGSLPGLTACVTRLACVEDLEPWLANGVPLAASVSYGILKGGPQAVADGHLVVVCGVTDTGEIRINDPGSREHPSRVVDRGTFARAWATSRNTVYLIHPDLPGSDSPPH